MFTLFLAIHFNPVSFPCARHQEDCMFCIMHPAMLKMQMVFRLGATLGFCVIYKTCIQESMWEPEQKVDGVITKTKFNATKMIIPPILSCAFLNTEKQRIHRCTLENVNN